jgi:hypothetical protein
MNTPTEGATMNKGLEAARKAPRAKRPSMRAAINAKCKECIYDDLSGLGTWRQQTEGCTSTECPLYELRPRTSGKKQQAGDV